ncbi:MAG TPA: hypothetical protein DER60_01120 [Syntrophomonas sp.]|jgi:uncharacterized membrane protein|nr:hypothetical protein [Syntrophomonas sp.]
MSIVLKGNVNMTGIYLYGSLILICFAVLGVTYWISRNRLTSIMYFTSIGLALFFDYIVYVWEKPIYTPCIY